MQAVQTAGSLASRCQPCMTHVAALRTVAALNNGIDTGPSSAASRTPRFYIPAPLAATLEGAVLRLPPDEARHATKTLRLRQGDRIELCDGSGWVVLAQIAAVDKVGAAVLTLRPGPQQVPLAGWQWEVACACGSLKGGRSDWLVEKCAELGAAAFTPLLTERSPTIGGGGGGGGGDKEKTVRRGSKGRRRDEAEAAASGREGRWERVARAAMKQCLRAYGMPISQPCTLQQLCDRIRASDIALVGVAGAPPLAAMAAQLQAGPPGRGTLSGVLCIGPEGDWTPAEVEQLVAAGAAPVGLGQLRLRAETAAVALLSYVRLLL